MQSLSGPARKGRVVLGTGRRTVIAFMDGADTVAVSFDSSALAPAAMMDGVALVNAAGTRLAGAASNAEAVSAEVGGWPVQVRVALGDEDALRAGTARCRSICS